MMILSDYQNAKNFRICKKIITCIFDIFVEEMGRTYLFVDGFSKLLKHIEGQTEHWIHINICLQLSCMENTELQNTVIRD